MARGPRRGRATGGDSAEVTQDLGDPRDERLVNPYDRSLADGWPGGTWPGGTWPGGIWPADDRVAPTRRRWVRVSAWATLGLMLSLVGLCATLTGLLAPEGLVLGVLGLLASIAGLVGASRPGITGHSLAVLGLLAGLAAIGISAAASTGHLRWLNSHTDAVPHWHAWLVAHWRWPARR